MRVLHVFGTMALGGAERRTVALLPFLDPATHPQHFATLSGAAGALDATIEARGGQVHPCALDAGFPLRFRRLLREIRPDVVHSHVHWASGPLLALARLNRVPGRILHFRASGDLHPPSRRRRLREAGFRAAAEASVTRVLGVSEGALDATWGPRWRNDPRCAVLYSGVQTDRFAIPTDRSGVRDELGIPRTAPIAIHVGNLAPAKNHRRLGRLFGALAAQRPDIWLVAVGAIKDLSCEAAFLAELDRAGVSQRVVLTGSREDVPRLLRAADSFVFPSVTEGLPGSVLEARAAGLPVVASDLPGTLEIARYVDRVQTLSLDQPDADWVRAILDSLGDVDDPGALAGTPFTAQASAHAHIQAWAAATNSAR